jgi:methionyl-tRNA synthetase
MKDDVKMKKELNEDTRTLLEEMGEFIKNTGKDVITDIQAHEETGELTIDIDEEFYNAYVKAYPDVDFDKAMGEVIEYIIITNEMTNEAKNEDTTEKEE